MLRDSREPQEQEHANDTAGNAEGLFERLIEIHNQAFAQRRYNTSYHVLCAALHWAQEEKDAAGIQIIEKLARKELDWINAQAPDYQHSSQSAALRGHTSIFENLERQAHMAMAMLHRERQYKRLGVLPKRMISE